jgi:Spy/CpxP family protein refolding chaperone
MKRYWILRGLRMIAFAALALAVLSYAVMALWNAVLPAVTGFHAISLIQAAGLLVLSRILFGGLRGWRHRGGHWRARMQARWQQMTPEEREQFRRAWGARRGCHPAAAKSGSTPAS